MHKIQIAVLLVSALPTFGKVIYVDLDAAGANNGTSWVNSYNYLQDALADANSAPKPVEIRVAQGIYKPDQGVNQTLGDRTASFQLINDVILKGGYAGLGEPDPNARDIDLCETILSGDLNGDDGPDFANNGENSYHVVKSDYMRSPAVLWGFTITGGNADGPNDWPNFREGAGMHNVGDPTVLDCTIIGNHADSRGGGTSPSDCGGGGKFIRCRIRGNTAGSYGGAVSAVFYDSPEFHNCVIVNNKAGVDGGGIYSSYSRLQIQNCAFYSNSSETGKGGGIYQRGNYLTIENSILWDNISATGGHEIAMIGTSEFTPVEVEVSCSDVRAGQGAIYQEGNYVMLVWHEGNIDLDPLFVDSNNGDYHLKSQASRWNPNSQTWLKDDVTSPCIDAGNTARPIGHEPFPNGGIINMGAYGGTAEASKSYFGEPVCETIVAGDINGDCMVDFTDFELMALHWLEDNTPVNSNSIVKDGVEYYIQTDKSVYHLGEDVQMAFRVTNLTTETVHIGCSRSGEFNLLVQKDHKTIWAWAHFWIWFSPGIELSANESKEVSHNWDMKADDGYLVEPGTYKVVGVMYNEPWNQDRDPDDYAPTEVKVTITIIPQHGL